MNVLILTGKFGMGHISAAQAVRQQLLAADPTAQVTIADVVDACIPHLGKLVYGWFDFTVNRCAGVYNILNRMAAHNSCTPMKRTMVQKLDDLLTRTGAELVISTLPLSSQYISAYKTTTGSTLPLFTYVTDISAHREWVAPGTDCYFVGDEETRRQLMGHGVAAEQIVVSGIPVRQEFLCPHSAPRREADREVLVMGGGLGLIPHAQQLLGRLASAPGVHVTVITGKNEALRRSLRAQYPTFEVIGFTDRVSYYMRRADLILTKAGGITTFEAIHTGTPLYILRPFLMQELQNADYIRRQGFGVVAHDAHSSPAEELLSLLQSPDTLEDMKLRMAVAVRTLEQVTPLERYEACEEENTAC